MQRVKRRRSKHACMHSADESKQEQQQAGRRTITSAIDLRALRTQIAALGRGFSAARCLNEQLAAQKLQQGDTYSVGRITITSDAKSSNDDDMIVAAASRHWNWCSRAVRPFPFSVFRRLGAFSQSVGRLAVLSVCAAALRIAAAAVACFTRNSRSPIELPFWLPNSHLRLPAYNSPAAIVICECHSRCNDGMLFVRPSNRRICRDEKRQTYVK